VVPDISYPSIPDPAMDLGAVLNTVSRLKETVEMMSGQRGDKRFSFPDTLRSVEAKSATSAARFTEQLTVTANSLEAVVTRTTTLEAQMGDAIASIVEEQTARATADTAMASEITTLTATVDSVSAQIVTESTARANADSALASQITTLTATVSSVNSQLVTESTVRANADTAFAGQLTTVEAKANDATASGQVYLIAESAPSGYSASYGWHLTASGASVGMKAMATGGGLGVIAFFADQFLLVDPSYLGGAPVEVFNYNGVTFNFDVPVTIRHQEIAANGVSNVAQVSGTVAVGVSIDVDLTVRANANVVIIAMIGDTSGTIYLGGFSTSFPARAYPVRVDGGGIGNIYTGDMVVANNYLGGSSYAFYKAVAPSTATFNVTGLSAGTHNFSIENTGSGFIAFSLVVIEHAR